MEAEKSVVRHLFAEAWNSKAMALVDELIAPTYVGYDVNIAHADVTKEGI
jgi:hypothetical protein